MVNGYAAVGEWIMYNITAENNGNVDIYATTVMDAMFKKTDGGWCKQQVASGAYSESLRSKSRQPTQETF